MVALLRVGYMAFVACSCAQVDSITIPVGPRLGDKVLEITHLSKAFGDRLLLDDVTFSVPPGGLGEAGASAAGGSPAYTI